MTKLGKKIILGSAYFARKRGKKILLDNFTERKRQKNYHRAIVRENTPKSINFPKIGQNCNLCNFTRVTIKLHRSFRIVNTKQLLPIVAPSHPSGGSSTHQRTIRPLCTPNTYKNRHFLPTFTIERTNYSCTR